MIRVKREATIGERVGAFMIDHIIFVMIFMTFIMFTMYGNYLGDPNGLGGLIGAGIIFMFLAYGFKDCIGGRSIGRRILGIYVRDANDPMVIPGTGRLFLRNITLPMWFVEVIILSFNPNMQRLGDLWAQTRVVKLIDDFEMDGYEAGYYEEQQYKKPKKNKVLAVSLSITLVVVLFITSIFATVIFGMKNSKAYKAAIDAIENDIGVYDEVGEIEGYGFMPMGSINITNGYGSADLQIKVKGDKDDTYVFAVLTSKPGEDWVVERLEY